MSRPALDIQRELRNAWGVLSFRDRDMSQVLAKPDGTEVALVFAVFGLTCSFLSGLIFPRAWTIETAGRARHIVHRPGLADLIGETVIEALALLAAVWLLATLARRWRGNVTFGQLFVVLGYASLAFALTIFPAMALAAFAWWFAVAYVALRCAAGLPKERALLAVLAGAAAVIVIAAIAHIPMFNLAVWFNR